MFQPGAPYYIESTHGHLSHTGVMHRLFFRHKGRSHPEIIEIFRPLFSENAPMKYGIFGLDVIDSTLGKIAGNSYPYFENSDNGTFLCRIEQPYEGIPAIDNGLKALVSQTGKTKGEIDRKTMLELSGMHVLVTNVLNEVIPAELHVGFYKAIEKIPRM